MSWISRLVNALNPRRLDEDLAEEMADHLERRAAALKARGGLSDRDARSQAQVRFGNTTGMKERSRERRLSATLERTIQDVLYAWRGMRRGPAFAVTAILSLALAIAANTAVYSIVDAAILRPLPVAEPQQLFRLSWPDISDPGSPAGQEREHFSFPEYAQFAELAKPAARLALFSTALKVELKGPNADSPVEHATQAFTSGEAFDLLGVRPALGRLFTVNEDRPQSRVAVLSYEYWQRRFLGDPSVVGRNLQIGEKAYQILGVTRKGFFGIEPGKFVDVWLPASQYDLQALTSPWWHWCLILGRLAPGYTTNQVQARLQPSFHDFQVRRVKLYPTMPAVIRKQFLESVIRVHPSPGGTSDFREAFSRPLWIVFGVAAVILLIACANVASLLLARATARVMEMAMRVSLGAARTRLVRQMLTESLVLALAAGGLGWLLARISAPLLTRLLSTGEDPVQLVLATDTRVLLFSIAVSTLSAVIFGLVPAWQASGVQPMSALRASSAQVSKLRIGRAFVSVQAACALCLVVVGASFLFSLVNLLRVNPGFDARNVVVLGVATDAKTKPEPVQRELMVQLQRRVASLPGVQGAALAMWPIFEGGGWSEQVILPGKGPSDKEEIFYRVSPGYFAALRTPLIAGRDFTAQDSGAGGLQPAIVNEAFARKYFDGVNILGREFSYQVSRDLVHAVIVGAAADAHYYNLRKPADPMVYLPIEGGSEFTLYVRTPLKTGSLVRLVDREARELGSGTRVPEVTTLEAIVGNTLRAEKLLAGVGGAFAFFGLLLASIGLFGLLTYSVGRRTKEIGIRAALGAGQIEIVSLVVRDVAALVGAGVLAGMAAAIAVMTMFRSLLFGIREADPFVIGAAVAVFLATGLVAASLPARRAVGIDPVVALREE